MTNGEKINRVASEKLFIISKSESLNYIIDILNIFFALTSFKFHHIKSKCIKLIKKSFNNDH